MRASFSGVADGELTSSVRKGGGSMDELAVYGVATGTGLSGTEEDGRHPDDCPARCRIPEANGVDLQYKSVRNSTYIGFTASTF